VDEGFVAKLIDVGSQVELDEGEVVWDDSHDAASLFLVLNGLLEVETRRGRDERGPGQVVGDLERLDGTEDVRVVAVTEARIVAVDRAAYEAALFG
jgi:CRP-like cAMP-binding protein